MIYKHFALVIYFIYCAISYFQINIPLHLFIINTYIFPNVNKILLINFLVLLYIFRKVFSYH